MLVEILCVTAAIGCGVVGGVFFAFSSFVMPGLARATPTTGLRAMQAINAAAVRPPFILVLFGTGLAALVASVVSAPGIAGESMATLPWAVGGATIYIATAIVLTGTYHVPRNTALAGVSADQADAGQRWNAYQREWTRWNHLRAVGSVAASLFFIVAASNA